MDNMAMTRRYMRKSIDFNLPKTSHLKLLHVLRLIQKIRNVIVIKWRVVIHSISCSRHNGAILFIKSYIFAFCIVLQYLSQICIDLYFITVCKPCNANPKIIWPNIMAYSDLFKPQYLAASVSAYKDQTAFTHTYDVVNCKMHQM